MDEILPWPLRGARNEQGPPLPCQSLRSSVPEHTHTHIDTHTTIVYIRQKSLVRDVQSFNGDSKGREGLL